MIRDAGQGTHTPLTDVFIRRLKPLEKPYKHVDGGGAFYSCAPTGSKLWRMSYRFAGKGNLLSFGEYPTASLKDAREKREEAKKLLAQGIDPSVQAKLHSSITDKAQVGELLRRIEEYDVFSAEVCVEPGSDGLYSSFPSC
ncbi:Arm DNA-binding domain-containing protein [Mailhella sp.]